MMSDRIGHWCSVRLQNIIRLVLSVVGEDDFFCRFNNNNNNRGVLFLLFVGFPLLAQRATKCALVSAPLWSFARRKQKTSTMSQHLESTDNAMTAITVGSAAVVGAPAPKVSLAIASGRRGAVGG